MEFYRLPVWHVRKDTRDAVVVEFTVPEDLRETFAFTQGQYLTLRAAIGDEEHRRSYSICANPRSGRLRVAIKRVDDGVFSSWAHGSLQVGDELEVAAPQGRFFVPLDAQAQRSYLAVAAGSGITPVLSLIETTLECEPHSSFTLVYGNRSASTTMFREELQRLKDRYLDRLALIFVTSRERQDIDAFNGRIDRERMLTLCRGWIDLDATDYVFICGPESMMEGVVAALDEREFPRERTIVERFATDGAAARERRERARNQPERIVHASVVLDGTARTFEIRKDTETVLEAGLRQGIDLPFSCKGGVCSSCRAQLTAGEVDMDVHFALEDYEVRSGVILMCQSHPVSEELTLDVDAIAAQLV
ncbi:MAG TPA: 2Fe-2S iron-sulfur cluster-binding protein [Candidatus Baltobacteraceae bacterium]|nr:2Fe-2S iron-sulfur cluster-binding protein [Candidatus Baltobacteraceae bacterium]